MMGGAVALWVMMMQTCGHATGGRGGKGLPPHLGGPW